MSSYEIYNARIVATIRTGFKGVLNRAFVGEAICGGTSS